VREVLLVMMAAGALLAQGPKYKLGKPASEAEIAKLDLFISPDGRGLPAGKGTAAQGKEVYERRCQKCHGANGTGGEESPLTGGKGSLATAKPLKTVGSFWPHATTLYDYIRRAMPFDNPGLLTGDQTYAVSALILHWNGIVGENDVLDAASMTKIKMPNRDGFVSAAGGKKK
jgi:S-disulfanyl-L-cysteine oxidoreductase SoxD